MNTFLLIATLAILFFSASVFSDLTLDSQLLFQFDKALSSALRQYRRLILNGETAQWPVEIGKPF